jgi:hypothetical protein
LKVQVTLTVAEAKRIIAKGIAARSDVNHALKEGRILLKGGTTVSAVAHELVGTDLRIGGRITVRGTKNALKKYDQFHCMLITNGSPQGADKQIEDITADLSKNDIIITSANAFDSEGYAAMMAAAPLGYYPGRAMGGFSSQGCKVIIAVGFEKMIPGSVRDAILASGRESMDLAMGSAVGLIPLVGELFTEADAISTLRDVRCTVISMGGIEGAEGATTMVIDGPETEVIAILDLVVAIKGTETSGTPESLEECVRGCPQCRNHLACMYKLGMLDDDFSPIQK